MSQALIQLALFTAKLFILLIFTFLFFLMIVILTSKSKSKAKGQLIIKNLNKKYEDIKEAFFNETLSKKELKVFFKEKKAKTKSQLPESKHNIFIINFNGDIKATAANALREEITAVLTVAKPQDEVVIRLESAGGVVHGYGLAAAELIRVREQNIRLTVVIDKVAASGGYLMACVADKIIAAPFSIIGSIGVVVQLPNFNRLLKDKNIDFEQYTAGQFKRTVTIFGENTEEGKKKLQHEIEDIHQSFKNLIQLYRKNIDIHKVATGEYWLANQAIHLNLVDELGTSDDYLFKASKNAKLYEIHYETKKPFIAKMASLTQGLQDKILNHLM